MRTALLTLLAMIAADTAEAHMVCRIGGAGGTCYNVTEYQYCWKRGAVDPLGCFSDVDASPICQFHQVLPDYPIVPCGGTACIVHGVTVPDGDTRPYYKAKKNGTCLSHDRTCTNGTLGPPFGGFDFPACNACELDGEVIEDGESRTAYSGPVNGGGCNSETRTCHNGDLTGSLEFKTCAAASPPEPCNKAGLITWRAAKNKVQWCNGTSWKDPSLNAGASCTGVTPGKISFNGGILQYCDGANWISMKGSSLGSCNAKPGTFKYVPASATYEYCDGSQSWKMGP